MLKSLEVDGFRAFRSLAIPSLGRVNLIVGKNNVGKTSLLEALRLFAYTGSPEVIADILRFRDETRFAQTPGLQPDIVPLWRLFHGREDWADAAMASIRIGPLGSRQEGVLISLQWWQDGKGTDTTVIDLTPNHPIREQEFGAARLGLFIEAERVGLQAVIFPEEFSDPRGLERLAAPGTTIWRRRQASQSPCVLLSAEGPAVEDLGRWWDRIALTNREEHVLDALRIIDPEVERLQFISVGEETKNRIPVVKRTGSQGPVPLRSLGDGMIRVLRIILGLATVPGGLLLIDEVENGIHYSAQTDLWRLILQVAARLDVQVFATSHSWDCISAFQQAASELPEQEGFLIRLHRKGGEVRATVFDEERLGIATRQDIEVR